MERIELKTHTTASAMRGVITPRRLVMQAKKYGMKALALTDINTVAAFPEINDAAKELYPGLKVIYGTDAVCKDSSGETHRYTVLAENRQGLANLYKLITYTNITANRQGFSISEKTLKKYREGLLIGGDSFDGICDYVQITPYADREHNIKIVSEGKACGKPVVAVGNVYCIDDTDMLCRKILCYSAGEKTPENTPFLSTLEMLNALSYLGEDAYTTVIENSVMIADRIEALEPIPTKPQIKSSEESITRIKNKCRERLLDLYGNHPPKGFSQRLENEFKSIESNNSAVLYDTVYRLSEWNAKLGYRHVLSGDLEKSFVSYLLGISEINPVPPHYRCTACKSVITDVPEDTVSGFDLSRATCPACGSVMHGDGQNLRFDFERGIIPRVSIGIHPALFREAVNFTCSLFGDSTLLCTGRTVSVSKSEAKRMIREYERAHNENLSDKTVCEAIDRLTEVNSQIVLRQSSLILPLAEGSFTPLCFSRNSIDSMVLGTQFDRKYIRRFAAVVDMAEDYIPTIYKELERFTGVPVDSIGLDDPEIYKTVSDGDVLGLLRCDTKQLRDAATTIRPGKFSDLPKVFAYLNRDFALGKNTVPFARFAWYKKYYTAEFYAVILNDIKKYDYKAEGGNMMFLESKETLTSLIKDIENRRNGDNTFVLAEETLMYYRLLVAVDVMNHGVCFLPPERGKPGTYRYLPENGCIMLPLK